MSNNPEIISSSDVNSKLMKIFSTLNESALEFLGFELNKKITAGIDQFNYSYILMASKELMLPIKRELQSIQTLYNSVDKGAKTQITLLLHKYMKNHGWGEAERCDKCREPNAIRYKWKPPIFEVGWVPSWVPSLNFFELNVIDFHDKFNNHLNKGFGIGAGNLSQTTREEHQRELMKMLEQVYRGRDHRDYERRDLLLEAVSNALWLRKKAELFVSKTNDSDVMNDNGSAVNTDTIIEEIVSGDEDLKEGEEGEGYDDDEDLEDLEEGEGYDDYEDSEGEEGEGEMNGEEIGSDENVVNYVDVKLYRGSNVIQASKMEMDDNDFDLDYQLDTLDHF